MNKPSTIKRDPNLTTITIDLDQWVMIKQLARRGADEDGWCTVCETTIGNGSVVHEQDCPLFEESDR